MSSSINSLSVEEKSLLMKAPILVCLLVAGADRNIDRKEIVGFLYQIYEFSHESASVVSEFYSQILNSVEKRLFDEYESLPEDPEERNNQLVETLSGLNDILPKIDKDFASSFYKSLKNMAIKVAKASGGAFGMGAISEEEKEYMELAMINPV